MPLHENPIPTPVRGGTPSLLENQSCGTALAEGGGPPSDSVRVPLQRLRRGCCCQAWASSSMAYHRSRSRGVGARTIRLRKSFTPSAIVPETSLSLSRPSSTPRNS